MANKTVVKDTDAEKVEHLCAELEISFEQKKQTDAEIKGLKEKILEYIDKDPQKYFKGQSSFKVGSIVITLSKEHKYELGEGFDLAKFFKKFPNAVKFELKHSQMTNIPLEAHDIAHSESEKIMFEHKVKKDVK